MSTSPVRICPGCGASAQARLAFCHICGQSLSEDVVNSPAARIAALPSGPRNFSSVGRPATPAPPNPAPHAQPTLRQPTLRSPVTDIPPPVYGRQDGPHSAPRGYERSQQSGGGWFAGIMIALGVTVALGGIGLVALSGRQSSDATSDVPRPASRPSAVGQDAAMAAYLNWSGDHALRFKIAHRNFLKWEAAYGESRRTPQQMIARTASMTQVQEPFLALQREARAVQPPAAAVHFHQTYCGMLDYTVQMVSRVYEVVYIRHHPGEVNGQTISELQAEDELRVLNNRLYTFWSQAQQERRALDERHPVSN